MCLKLSLVNDPLHKPSILHQFKTSLVVVVVVGIIEVEIAEIIERGDADEAVQIFNFIIRGHPPVCTLTINWLHHHHVHTLRHN